MVIKEHFPDLVSWTIDIVGTDLSDDMIRRSRNGLYSQLEVNRGLPAPLLVRYFERDRGSSRLSRQTGVDDESRIFSGCSESFCVAFRGSVVEGNARERRQCGN